MEKYSLDSPRNTALVEGGSSAALEAISSNQGSRERGPSDAVHRGKDLEGNFLSSLLEPLRAERTSPLDNLGVCPLGAWAVGSESHPSPPG